MSRPPQRENGPYQEGGARQEPPMVYHPAAEPTPVYDAYADPAAAHGWEGNAYDETSELPRIPARQGWDPDQPGWVPEGPGWDPERHGWDPEPEGGRAERRRARRRPLWRSPRVLAAGGAVGVVSVAALVAGLGFGASDETPGKPAPAASGSSDVVDPGGSPAPSATGATGADRQGSPESGSGGEAVAPSPSPSSASPLPSASASASAAAPPPADSRPGNSDSKGKGGSKGPR